MIALILAIFQGLAAIPSIFNYCEQFAAAIVGWYMQYAKNADMAAIANAVDLQANAKTQADRFAAADAWQAALKKSRFTND